MKIKNLLYLLLIFCLAISCSNREDEPTKSVENYPLLMKLDSRLLNISAPIMLPDYNFYFEYDNAEKLTKKIGGFLSTSGSTGFGGIFSTEIYTNLLYQGDNVTVEDFSSSTNFTVPKNSKYFKLNSSNLIAEKETPDPLSNYRYRKEFFYYKNGRLDEIKTTLPNAQYDPTDPNDYIETYSEKFYYDSVGNLTETEYFELHNGINTENKRIRYFENYDSSTNPFRKFTLLDEYFYRSLSKNNFRSYKEVKIWYGITNVSQQSWEFNYDSKGNIILN